MSPGKISLLFIVLCSMGLVSDIVSLFLHGPNWLNIAGIILCTFAVITYVRVAIKIYR